MPIKTKPLNLPFINNGFDHFSKLFGLNILDKACRFHTLVHSNLYFCSKVVYLFLNNHAVTRY